MNKLLKYISEKTTLYLAIHPFSIPKKNKRSSSQTRISERLNIAPPFV